MVDVREMEAWGVARLRTKPSHRSSHPILPSQPTTQFSAGGESATVSLGGQTRALATVTASLDAPYPDR